MPTKLIDAAEEMMAGNFTQADIQETYNLTDDEFQAAYDLACEALGYAVKDADGFVLVSCR